MELLLVGALGTLGYILSGNEDALPSTTLASPVQLHNTVNAHPVRVDELPSTMLARHDTLARQRWDAARDPKNGIIDPNVRHPFFRSSKTQNLNEDINQRRMDLFTGTNSESWHPKKEVTSLFTPQQQAITSGGSSGNSSNYDPSRYVTGLTGVQNNTIPFEQQRVGPGVNVNTDVAASGGFHSTYRPPAPDLGGYKKNTLEGRINPGGGQISAREVDPLFYSKNVPRFWDMERRPLEKGRATVTATRVRPEVHIKGHGQCHVNGEDYFGIAGKTSHNVQDGAWNRTKRMSDVGVPVTNVSGARAGIGGFVEYSPDTSRIMSQKREQNNAITNVRGDQFRQRASYNFDMAPTHRALHDREYDGIAGHYVSHGTSHPLDAPQPTLREQLHDQGTGFGAAAPVTSGPRVQCTNKQLLKESKRSAHVINTYITHAERTDALKRASGSDLTRRCYGSLSVKKDGLSNRIVSHAQAGVMYNNQASPGQATSSALSNKLESMHPHQDFSIASTVLKNNPLIALK